MIRIKKFSFFLFLLACLAISLPANAQSLLSLGAGYYDIGKDDGAADFRLEYRPDVKLFWKIKPWVGGEVTSEASVWGGGGLILDLDVTDHIYFSPSFGAGLYAQGSSDKDLGHAIEFRSQAELGYKFDGGQRLGVAFGHISNASIGNKNPGVEILNLYYHVPIGTALSGSLPSLGGGRGGYNIF
ncbi:MAG: acyloxyacyl hydrolase [Rhodospirillales bacterium]|nr:acyloxyacyl hydrolase [Alphaproteobacteria bacterium]USO03274.1 MAG: acyloxyacyl hydrolase [Rhodospirillales bacterium]